MATRYTDFTDLQVIQMAGLSMPWSIPRTTDYTIPPRMDPRPGGRAEQ
jgi:hypothetical protein